MIDLQETKEDSGRINNNYSYIRYKETRLNLSRVSTCDQYKRWVTTNVSFTKGGIDTLSTPRLPGSRGVIKRLDCRLISS